MFGEFSCLRLNSLAALVVLPFSSSASPTLRPSPAVAGLEVFRCGPPHGLSLHVCVGPF